MKYFLLPICLLFAMSAYRPLPLAHAEPYVGGKIGPNFAKFKFDSTEPNPGRRTYQTGLSAGVFAGLRLWRPFVPQLELMFTNRGSETKVDDRSLGSFDLNYIDLTALARAELSIRSKTSLYGAAGPMLSILVTAKKNDAGGERSIKDGLRSLDVGLMAGAGVIVGPFAWGGISLEARYEIGLINTDKDNTDSTFKNRTIAVVLGYEYRFLPPTLPRPTDRDRDGISDNDDACRDSPEDVNGFEDDDGCPDGDKDLDRDGVLDFQDQCRGEPEDQDGVADEDGCPDPDAPNPHAVASWK